MSAIRARTATLAVLVASLGTAAGRADDTSSPPSWTWRVGQTRRFEFKQQGVSRPKPEGQMAITKTRTEVVFALTAKSVAEDGASELELGVESVKAEIESGPLRGAYDSSKAATQGQGRVYEAFYRPAIEARTHLKMDRNGRVSDVRIPDRVQKAVSASPFAASEDVMGLLTSSGVATLFAVLSPVLPDPPLQPGMTRERTVEPRLTPAPLRLELVDRLKDDEASILKLEVKGRVTAPRDATAGGVEIAVTDSSVTGEFEFRKSEGQLGRSTLRQRLSLRLTVEGSVSIQGVEVDHSLAAVAEAPNPGSDR